LIKVLAVFNVQHDQTFQDIYILFLSTIFDKLAIKLLSGFL